MKKIGFVMILAVIAFIWGCAEYAPTPEVTISYYEPIGFLVPNDTTQFLDTLSEVDFKVINGVDAYIEYLTVNYYNGDTYLFSDNSPQSCPIYLSGGATDMRTDSFVVVTYLWNYPVNIKEGIKYMYSNSTINSLTAEVVFHGHAYYDENNTFTTSLKLTLIKSE